MNPGTIKTSIEKKYFPVTSWKTQAGFSLLEVMFVVSLIVILGSIVVVNYKPHIDAVKLKQLKEISELFPKMLQVCVTASGGWEITRPDETTVQPCDTLEKIDFICPPSSKSAIFECTLYENSADGYICLDLRKKDKKDRKYQVYTIAEKSNVNNYKVLCNKEVASYTSLDDNICNIPSSADITPAVEEDDCEW